jgi:hypothetical protein
VKVNSRDTDGPPAITTPYGSGPLGDDTPPPGTRVPTRLAVSRLPVFFTAKATVTVSPGSMLLVAGEQLSPPTNVDPADSMTGVGSSAKSWTVVPPSTTTTLAEADV